MELTKKGDFVEIKFTGYVHGKIFDSNIEEDLKEMNSTVKPVKNIVVIGQEMVVSGLDKALEGKEIGKEYNLTLKPMEGFGERKKELVKTIPLHVFTERNVSPHAGLLLNLDDMIAKVITVSGARVITDFNNPLAGKEIVYRFTIFRKVEDENEKVIALFNYFFRFVPEFEIKDKIIVIGAKPLEEFVKASSQKFKELIGKELTFELKEEKKDSELKNTVKNSKV